MEAFEFTAARADLLQALQSAYRVAAIACIKVHDRGIVQVDATGGHVSVMTTVPIPHGVRGKVGAGVALGCADMVAVLGAMQDERVVVRHVGAGKVEIHGLRHEAVYRFATDEDTAISGFPWHEHASAALLEPQVDAAAVREMIDCTRYAIAGPDRARALQGLLFESDGIIGRMTCSDGHRLHRVERRLKGVPISGAFIIPEGGVDEMGRVLEPGGQASMAIAPPHLFVRAGRTVLAVERIDEEFPDLDRVFPGDDALRVSVDRRRLLELLASSAALVCRRSGMRMHVRERHLVMEGRRADHGEWFCRLACPDGADALVAERCVNPKYLRDALSAMSGEVVTLEFSVDHLGPIAIHDGDDVAVMMPMRLWEEV